MTCRTWHPAEAQLRTSNNPMLRACRKPCRTWHPAEAQLHSCRPDQPPSAACRTWCKTSGQRPCPRRIQSTAQLSSVPVSRSPYRTWPSHSCRTWCRAPSLSASAQGQQRQDWTGSPDGLGGAPGPFLPRTDVRKNKKERGATEEQRGCAVLEQTLIWTQLCGSASAFDIIRSCDRQEAITGSEQARWASARACMYGRKAAVEELKNMGADTVYERRQTVFL